MIKDHPCKVMNFSTAKTGKHGSAKCMITGIDIFTSQKYECTYGSGDMVDAPIVNRIEYTLINIDDEGFCSLMTEAGDIKEDLKLPTDDHLKEIVQKIRDVFEAGNKECLVSAIASMGQEKIIDVREGKDQ